MERIPTSGHMIERKNQGPLSYLERGADSEAVTVFLHGLGLDATDYLEYLQQHDTHSVAVSLYGYDPEAATGTFPPVPLDRHIEMIATFVEGISHKNPAKNIVLVGFSLGADLVLQLAEHWSVVAPQRRLPLSAAVLLDPNVNHSTMTISSLFADADPCDPLSAFKKLINLAPDMDSLRSLCHYLAKVAPKDFKQVWQLSRDMIGYWNPAGYDQFGARLAKVAQTADHVRVVLSAPYEEHLPAMEQAVRSRGGASGVSFGLTKLEHFGLIGNDVLARELAPFT
jgi:pimeloyl-ACP methyl ester carboxylesterase